MTLTYKHDLYTDKANHRAEYLGQRSLRSKVIVRTHTHTQPAKCTTRPLKP